MENCMKKFLVIIFFLSQSALCVATDRTTYNAEGQTKPNPEAVFYQLKNDFLSIEKTLKSSETFDWNFEQNINSINTFIQNLRLFSQEQGLSDEIPLRHLKEKLERVICEYQQLADSYKLTPSENQSAIKKFFKKYKQTFYMGAATLGSFIYVYWTYHTVQKLNRLKKGLKDEGYTVSTKIRRGYSGYNTEYRECHTKITPTPEVSKQLSTVAINPLIFRTIEEERLNSICKYISKKQSFNFRCRN